jgi:hypothetical protein
VSSGTKDFVGMSRGTKDFVGMGTKGFQRARQRGFQRADRSEGKRGYCVGRRRHHEKKCWQQLGKLASEARTAVRTNQRGRAVSVKTEQLQGIQNITEDLHKFNAWLIGVTSTCYDLFESRGKSRAR